MRFSFVVSFLVCAICIVSGDEVACRQAIDVMFLQDTTRTFENDLEVMTNSAFEIFASINDIFPGSKFGVAEFKDKPFLPLGFPEFDYCYRLGGSLSDVAKDFHDAYAQLYASAGGDPPEASYQALINVALDANVGWRELGTASGSTAETTVAARVIILVTDALPHMAGDMTRYPDEVPQLPANPGTIWQDKFNEFCESFDYPSFTQVGDVLSANNMSVILLIKPDAGDPSVVAAWEWVNSQVLKQPEWFLHLLAEDSKDVVSVVEEIMDTLAVATCEVTTTQPPTTPKPTTVKVGTTEDPARTTTWRYTSTTQPPTTPKPTTVKVGTTEDSEKTPEPSTSGPTTWRYTAVWPSTEPTTAKVGTTEDPARTTTWRYTSTTQPPTATKPTTAKVGTTEDPARTTTWRYTSTTGPPVTRSPPKPDTTKDSEKTPEPSTSGPTTWRYTAVWPSTEPTQTEQSSTTRDQAVTGLTIHFTDGPGCEPPVGGCNEHPHPCCPVIIRNQLVINMVEDQDRLEIDWVNDHAAGKSTEKVTAATGKSTQA